MGRKVQQDLDPWISSWPAIGNSVFICCTELQTSQSARWHLVNGFFQAAVPSLLQGSCKIRAISCKEAVRPLSLHSFGGNTESFLLGSSVRDGVDVSFREAC